MAELTERLQVLLDRERRQLERESQRTGAPVAALVRAAIDLAYPRRHEDEDEAWDRLLAAEPMPVEDWETMKRLARDELSETGRVSLGRVLLDSAVFVYAAGSGNRYRAPCVRLLQGLHDRESVGEPSVLTVQEVLHQRARRTGNRADAAGSARDLTAVTRPHHVTIADPRLAVRLFAHDRACTPPTPSMQPWHSTVASRPS